MLVEVEFNLLAFSSTFLLILLAEMGDKTQIMTITLASKYRSPKQVFIGAFLGTTTISLIGILVGSTLASIISVNVVSRIAGAIFILFGVISILRKESEEEIGDIKKSRGQTRLLMVFSLISAAELGDKTQLAIIALAAEYASPLSVAVGATSGFAALTIIAVSLGRGISRIIPISLIQKIAAITFILLGIIFLLGIL